MSALKDRIAQFRKMSTDDPDNELGHFRLGQLLMEDGQIDEAVASFRRTLELEPNFSKVYQLLGEALIHLDRTAEATETLTKGYTVAHGRGDKMPRDEMGKLLVKLGQPLPQVETAAAEEEDTIGPGGTGFKCKRPVCPYGKRARGLMNPPIPDAIGKRIFDEICADCWNDWFKNQSIKVINELRLDLSTDFGQGEYDKYMRDFFGFEEATPATATTSLNVTEGGTPPAQG
ncbi:Fe(2+)-trafficking protein [Tuwongella immobilis]|uniref:Uncharacterized protein n=1 Tax=Tuwongella immobilis TaxID=692036 RepID=A0A6C2YNU0_9BACT|nr:Fe(2+)-trafficking protein [Tuwongella immobilis]VIP03290.1 iron transporter : Uncharacterized protein OS=Phycisphaera mikurensis (strain NBRC 102666 / KCTC 22515 / FYK2301M01) GN=PSMK_05250 PE=4 SV=1: TPR_11: Iron_traffic [Tuwongella immobilis]VTS03951.1 iron transporter : Uncharacterized protein OS=Phycisphaera mikurensis (strain NBRC 102666 / KCTC 22515 / FYK2301M01) GN=PSMK_05250 PE=4 SV=1: TPR_11: Iron_traffic [Tuwongella immobilis]